MSLSFVPDHLWYCLEILSIFADTCLYHSSEPLQCQAFHMKRNAVTLKRSAYIEVTQKKFNQKLDWLIIHSTLHSQQQFFIRPPGIDPWVYLQRTSQKYKLFAESRQIKKFNKICSTMVVPTSSLHPSFFCWQKQPNLTTRVLIGAHVKFQELSPVHLSVVVLSEWNFKQNKRPMGHIAHMRNQFKSTNTFEQSYDYIYYKIGPLVQEKKIFKITWIYLCNFVNTSLSKKVWLFHLNILKYSSHRDAFCQVWLKLCK